MLRAQLVELVHVESRPVRAAEQGQQVYAVFFTKVLNTQTPRGSLQRLWRYLRATARQEFEQCMELVTPQLERKGGRVSLCSNNSKRRTQRAFFPLAAFLVTGLLFLAACFSFGGLSAAFLAVIA